VSRYVDVVASVSGRGYGAVSADVRERLGAIAFPFEHHAEIIEGPAGQRDRFTMLLGATLLVLLAIVLVLQVACGSWRLAAGVFVAIAAAMAGGVLAVLVTGAVVSLGTLVGLLALLALASRLIVGQVLHYRQLAAEGVELSPALVGRGTSERLGAALTTVLAVGLLFAPFALVGPIAGLELMSPMALTVLSGLVSTVAVLVFVVPALYLAAGGRTAQPDLGIDLPSQRRDEFVITAAKV
jgi:Cu/Ag efflux pump CusA